MVEQKLVIWGCGGMGREVAALCEVLGKEVIGFLDERPNMRGQFVDGIPVLGDIDELKGNEELKKEIAVVCAGVGDPALKRRLVNKTRGTGFSLAGPLIHPSVPFHRSSNIGLGSIVCAGSVVSINVNIGEFVIVNTNVTLAHDDSVSDYATISPGVNISGHVEVGEGAFIGTGSAIREKVTIGAWSYIGGGAFVKDDVPSHTMFAGVPAVFKKARGLP